MLFFTKISIIIHFGKNPKNGGSPPKEINRINNEIFINLLVWNILNVWFKLKSLKLFNKITIDIFKKL